MLIGFTAVIITVCILIGIVILKRDALSRILSSNHEVIRTRSHFQQELEKTAEQVIVQLEDKIFHLEYLLQEADKKMTVLDEKVIAAELAYNKLKELPPQAFDLQPPETNRYTGLTEKETVGTARQDSATKKQTDKRGVVLEMADQGYNATEISRMTGIGKGEVLLLLQLSKR